jgi:hypothetical protein
MCVHTLSGSPFTHRFRSSPLFHPSAINVPAATKHTQSHQATIPIPTFTIPTYYICIPPPESEAIFITKCEGHDIQKGRLAMSIHQVQRNICN